MRHYAKVWVRVPHAPPRLAPNKGAARVAGMKRILLWGRLGVAALLVAGAAFLFHTLYALSVPKPLALDPDEALAPQLDAWLAQLHEREQFNGVVSLGRAGEAVFRAAVGSTDKTGATALTPDASMRLGSVSKTFTATAVLTLVQEGRVDLDAPLSRYLPECAFDGVTPRHLLQHRSGIADDYMRIEHGGVVVGIADVVAHACAPGRTAQNAPSAVYSYSNTGFVLLAGLVERVSGATFEDYLHDAVLEPLGMRQSRVWTLQSTPADPAPTPTFLHWDRLPEAQPPGPLDGVSGDGAVHASLLDLERYLRAWIDETVLSPA